MPAATDSFAVAKMVMAGLKWLEVVGLVYQQSGLSRGPNTNVMPNSQ